MVRYSLVVRLPSPEVGGGIDEPCEVQGQHITQEKRHKYAAGPCLRPEVHGYHCWYVESEEDLQ